MSDERSHSWIGKVTELVVAITLSITLGLNVKIVDLNNSQFEVAQVGDPIPSGIKTHLKQRKEDVRGDVKST